MEMNYMLAYGSAEASLRLLWRFGLLEVLLPIQVQNRSLRTLTLTSINIHFFHIVELHRLLTLFHKDFEGATKDQICCWYMPFLSLIYLYLHIINLIFKFLHTGAF